MPELKAILESFLFVSSEPVSLERLRRALPEEDAQEVRAALSDLEAEYEARGGGFFLARVAGGFQLRTRPACGEYIRRFQQAQPMKLSKAALETLAIIAYKQPALRSDIEHVRGVDSGGVLRFLMEKKLVRVLGRKDIPGRPMIYATTRKFLELFDLNDLSDLPSLKDIQEMAARTESSGTPQDPLSPEPEPASPLNWDDEIQDEMDQEHAPDGQTTDPQDTPEEEATAEREQAQTQFAAETENEEADGGTPSSEETP